jgi:glycosyltransferase involved in cell wall biosynthesis
MQTSVIICSHNPRPEYLRRTLNSLRAQTVALSDWELLLVDNASQHRLSDSWDLSWHPNHDHIRENELGLTAARLRGIQEARGNILVFVDDDNVLACDFLERLQDIVADNPHLSVFGAGVLEPEFEAPPSPEVVPFLGHLALRSVSSKLWSNNPADVAVIPWGAGMAVTRDAAEFYCHLVEELNVTVIDRRGEKLYCGGDDLFSWAAAMTGKGFGLFPELRVTHLISAYRLNPRYLVQLLHDHSFSHGVLRYRLTGVHGAETGRAMSLIWNLWLLLHGLKHGRFSMRCRLAGIRGREQAARFISGNRLRPLENYLHKTAVDRAKTDLKPWSHQVGALRMDHSMYIGLLSGTLLGG